jgi:hypothetical protein
MAFIAIFSERRVGEREGGYSNSNASKTAGYYFLFPVPFMPDEFG